MCHKWLFHLNLKTLSELSRNDLITSLPQHTFAKESLCSACEQGKHTRASFKSKQISSVTALLQLLHMDLFGLVNVQSLAGKKFSLVIVDEYAKYTWVFFLRSKDEAPEEIISFIKKIKVLNNVKV